jgi:hypothetical protein
MTLRVRISIVPFGDEEQEREIHQINISNLKDLGLGLCEYGVEMEKYKTGNYDLKLTHQRQDGPLVLVSKVLGRLTYE